MQKITLKNNLFCGMIITLCFLWTASGYLSWLYRLMDFSVGSNVDWLTEVVGYVFQAAGILCCSLLGKKYPGQIYSRAFFSYIMIADFLFILCSTLAGSLPLCLIFGYLMNYLHGIVAMLYLFRLAVLVEWKHRSFTFGVSYGIASLGSWLISLIGSGNFLCSHYVLIVYAVLVLLTLGFVWQEKLPDLSDITFHAKPVSSRLILLAGATVLLLSLVRGIGFYFPMADVATGINLELSRAFYGIGLATAGILGDRNRKYGAISCIAALVFPFLMLSLTGEVTVSILFWILGYIFFGFYTVYRVVVFSDLARGDCSLLFVAGYGLMFGRLGDAAGSLLGMTLADRHVALVVLASLCFAVTIIVFFTLYHQLYMPLVKRELSEDELLMEFAKKYELSGRELEVLKLLLGGLSNGEISAQLFISESTVKFHIRNLLKKTECANRMALIALVKR